MSNSSHFFNLSASGVQWYNAGNSTFWSADNLGSKLNCWKINHIFLFLIKARISSSFTAQISSHSKWYDPALRGCKHAIIFKRVDFHHQLSHISATNSHSLISRFIHFKTSISSQLSRKYDLCTFSSFIIVSFFFICYILINHFCSFF